MNILEIKDLKKVYRIRSKNKKEFTEVSALDGVNLTIKEGEFVSIIGPSGSGKSTLMQIMGLLDNASSGTVRFLGKDITKMNDNEISDLRRNYIGFVFQFFNLLSKTTALDNVNLPLIYSRHSSKDKASKLLDMVGLSERKKHKPNQLSGGQQQRVAIARSLVNDPKIIFADEPTGNISQAQSKEVMSYFSRLNADGVTIVLVTHDPKVAEQAKRIITIKDGKVESDVENPNFKTEVLNKIAAEEENNEVGSDSVVDVVVDSKENKSIFSRVAKLVASIMNIAFLKENISVAYKSLVSNKFRTFLSVFGITIGITAVVTMVSLGEGTKENIKKQLEKMGTNRIEVQRNWMKRGNYTSNDWVVPKDYELIKSLQKNYPIEYVARYRWVEKYSVIVSYLDKNYTISNNFNVVFTDSSYSKINNLEFKLGSFFVKEQEDNFEKVCVIGSTIYDNLFKKGENPIGKKIYISQTGYDWNKAVQLKSVFTIVGLLNSSGSDTFGDDQGEQIFIPYSTWEHRFVTNSWDRNMIFRLLIKVKNTDEVNYMKDVLTQKLAERRGIKDIKSVLEKNRPLLIEDPSQILEARAKTDRTLSTLLIIIACISLFVGGIGIMNIMIVSVKERTREIGLRKALGARKLDVLFQFIVEAIMIGLIGGGAGIILGGIISSIMSIWIASHLSWKMVFIAFGFSFVVALVFGYLPAKRAAELSPVEALRYE